MKPLSLAAGNLLTAAAVACFAAVAAPAGGEPIAFDSSWTTIRLPRLNSNEYEFSGKSLIIRSDNSVSIVAKFLPERLWRASNAQWQWAVYQSVPPTDLSRRGGDDRNIMIYFLFMPEQAIRSMKSITPRKLITDSDVKILSVAWGGRHLRGEVMDDPFADGRGKIIALRQSGIGIYDESFDISRSYAAAFGSAPGELVAVAVGSDSDDTNSAVLARVTGLELY